MKNNRKVAKKQTEELKPFLASMKPIHWLIVVLLIPVVIYIALYFNAVTHLEF